MNATLVSTPVMAGKVYLIASHGKTRRTLAIRVIKVVGTAKATQSGLEYTTVIAYRVRPYDRSISFGERKAYCRQTSEFYPA